MEYYVAPFFVKSLNDKGMFSGYASVYHVVDAHQDRVIKGAFAQTLHLARSKNQWPCMLLEHDLAREVGQWVELHDNAHGLFVRGALSLEAEGASTLYDALKEGHITGLSIGYEPLEFLYCENVRLLTKIHLGEISLVQSPANHHARVLEVKGVGR